MVDAGLLSIEQEVTGLRHHHRRQNQAQLLCIPQPVAAKRGARLAGEITGLASLAQPPGPNHTLAHTGATVLQWAGLMQQRFKSTVFRCRCWRRAASQALLFIESAELSGPLPEGLAQVRLLVSQRRHWPST